MFNRHRLKSSLLVAIVSRASDLPRAGSLTNSRASCSRCWGVNSSRPMITARSRICGLDRSKNVSIDGSPSRNGMTALAQKPIRTDRHRQIRCFPKNPVRKTLYNALPNTGCNRSEPRGRTNRGDSLRRPRNSLYATAGRKDEQDTPILGQRLPARESKALAALDQYYSGKPSIAKQISALGTRDAGQPTRIQVPQGNCSVPIYLLL